MLRLGCCWLAVVAVRPSQVVTLQVFCFYELFSSGPFCAALRTGQSAQLWLGSWLVDSKLFHDLLFLQTELAWHTLLTRRLSEEIKLVGPVISCEGAAYRGNTTGHWRKNPHVQSYVLAMDQAALQVLAQEGQVMQCHSDRWDAVYFGELGASLAILNAGYNIDSLLVRWRIYLLFHYCSFSAEYIRCLLRCYIMPDGFECWSPRYHYRPHSERGLPDSARADLLLQKCVVAEVYCCKCGADTKGLIGGNRKTGIAIAGRSCSLLLTFSLASLIGYYRVVKDLYKCVGCTACVSALSYVTQSQPNQAAAVWWS